MPPMPPKITEFQRNYAVEFIFLLHDIIQFKFIRLKLKIAALGEKK